jgi:hypothetical protein
MDQAAVVRDIREAEKAAAIGWRGAPAAEKPVAALRELLQELGRTEDPKYESSFTLKDRMSQIVFLALCARYGLTAVRRKGQRSTTVSMRRGCVNRRSRLDTLDGAGPVCRRRLPLLANAEARSPVSYACLPRPAQPRSHTTTAARGVAVALIATC